ncbi:winged helix-turn-helix transcriptional regulator [Streptomyces sp. NBC_01235]|uniref:winged helix-turn-helix transcriptional regulator n=1 Tax=Streptomyces sp. NBC_01235 TaxID=2903788 RepID=UPI002E0E4FCB|nr:helix-turn-helix transcriptional regulator [Streptomyces sp. NBC_01235]
MPSCSIARTLEVVGEKWTILVLREVWYGSSRFSDFERVLGCPRNLLAARLPDAVEERILATETCKEPGSRSRPKYVITPKGMDLVPAVMGSCGGATAAAPTRRARPYWRDTADAARTSTPRSAANGATPCRRKMSRASPALHSSSGLFSPALALRAWEAGCRNAPNLTPYCRRCGAVS